MRSRCAEDVVDLRRKVTATIDDRIDESSADVVAVLANGRREHVFVEHAIGSLHRPMTDADLEAKFHGLVDPVLGAARATESDCRGVAAGRQRRRALACCAGAALARNVFAHQGEVFDIGRLRKKGPDDGTPVGECR